MLSFISKKNLQAYLYEVTKVWNMCFGDDCKRSATEQNINVNNHSNSTTQSSQLILLQDFY